MVLLQFGQCPYHRLHKLVFRLELTTLDVVHNVSQHLTGKVKKVIQAVNEEGQGHTGCKQERSRRSDRL